MVLPTSTASQVSFVQGFTTLSGPRIRYLANRADVDPSAGLPLVFAPGVSDFADEYHEVLEFFLPRRALVVEVRGRGGSEAPASGYHVDDHMADLMAVLDEEGIDVCHLMTFSRGSSWGLELALTHPSRVASLSIGDYWAIELAMADDFTDRMMATRFRGKPLTDRIQPHVLAGLQQESRSRALWSHLGDLPFPLLVAVGTEPGRLVDEAGIRQYREARADVEIVVIEGAAHDLFRPDRLAYPRAVADFIARRTGS